MIYDLISNCGIYEGLSPAIDTALAFMKKASFDRMQPGRYELDNGVYYSVQRYDVKPLDETKWECHRRYCDIQLVLDIGECIGYAATERLDSWGAYSEENDVCFSESTSKGIILPMPPGTFAFFAPTDAHRPCIMSDGKKLLTKIVIKIPV